MNETYSGLEVAQDLIQIGDTVFRVGKGATMGAMKVISTIDKLQWKGKASLSHFHRLAGSHTGYLSIDTQDPAVMKDLGKRFEKYGVLYAELPDLNSRDGQRQIVFNSDQVSGVQAMINDYNEERLTRLREFQNRFGKESERYAKEKSKLLQKMPSIRSMTADDYAKTRFEQKERETRAYEYMKQSAMRQEQEAQARAQDAVSRQQKKQAEKLQVQNAVKEAAKKEAEKRTLKGKAKTLRNVAGTAALLGMVAEGKAKIVEMQDLGTIVIPDPATGIPTKLNASMLPDGSGRIGLFPPTAVVSKGLNVVVKEYTYYVMTGKGPVERLLGDDLIKAYEESKLHKGIENIKKAEKERKQEIASLAREFEEYRKGRSR